MCIGQSRSLLHTFGFKKEHSRHYLRGQNKSSLSSLHCLVECFLEGRSNVPSKVLREWDLNLAGPTGTSASASKTDGHVKGSYPSEKIEQEVARKRTKRAVNPIVPSR